MSDIQYLNREM